VCSKCGSLNPPRDYDPPSDYKDEDTTGFSVTVTAVSGGITVFFLRKKEYPYHG